MRERTALLIAAATVVVSGLGVALSMDGRSRATVPRAEATSVGSAPSEGGRAGYSARPSGGSIDKYDDPSAGATTGVTYSVTVVIKDDAGSPAVDYPVRFYVMENLIWSASNPTPVPGIGVIGPMRGIADERDLAVTKTDAAGRAVLVLSEAEMPFPSASSEDKIDPQAPVETATIWYDVYAPVGGSVMNMQATHNPQSHINMSNRKRIGADASTFFRALSAYESVMKAQGQSLEWSAFLESFSPDDRHSVSEYSFSDLAAMSITRSEYMDELADRGLDEEIARLEALQGDDSPSRLTPSPAPTP